MSNKWLCVLFVLLLAMPADAGFRSKVKHIAHVATETVEGIAAVAAAILVCVYTPICGQ